MEQNLTGGPKVRSIQKGRHTFTPFSALQVCANLKMGSEDQAKDLKPHVDAAKEHSQKLDTLPNEAACKLYLETAVLVFRTRRHKVDNSKPTQGLSLLMKAGSVEGQAILDTIIAVTVKLGASVTSGLAPPSGNARESQRLLDILTGGMAHP